MHQEAFLVPTSRAVVMPRRPSKAWLVPGVDRPEVRVSNGERIETSRVVGWNLDWPRVRFGGVSFEVSPETIANALNTGAPVWV
jgi:hypothetical protein